MIFMQAGEDLVQDFQVLLVHVGVHTQVVDVDQHICNVAYYSFLQLLETGWASQESHR
jgi:hypothetical protein